MTHDQERTFGRQSRFTLAAMVQAVIRGILLCLMLLHCETSPAFAQDAPLPPSRKAELRVQVGHFRSVYSATFSPDGAQVLTGARDNTVKLWDAATGKLLLSLGGHTGRGGSAAFAPDGTRVLTVGFDNTAKLWDAATGRPLHLLEGHSAPVNSAAFTPDGARVLTISGDNTVKLWDATKGQLLHSLERQKIFPGGARMLTANNDSTAKLWDVATGQLLYSLAGHMGWVDSAKFSPDGARMLTGGNGNKAWLWDATTGQRLHSLEGHWSQAIPAQFSPDGARVLTTSMDNTVKLWDSATGKLLHSLAGHWGGATSAAFSPDGARVLTCDNSSTARLWDATTGQLLLSLKDFTNGLHSPAFSPDGARVLTISGVNGDNTVKLWHAATGQLLHSLEGHTEPLTLATLAPDGARMLTVGGDRAATSWHLEPGNLQRSLKLQMITPDVVPFLTTNSDSSTAKLWDAATGQLLHSLAGHTGEVVSSQFSPDGARVLTTSWEDWARLWDGAAGQLLHSLTNHTEWVSSAVFAPDGTRVLTASGDKTAKLWDAATGELLHSLEGHTSWVNSAVLSPDGALVLTASRDKTAKLWDAATGKLLHSLEGHWHWVKSATFSPDSQRILTASDDQSARLWDAATGKLLHSLEGHTDWVNSAVFSPDGARVLTASSDQTAKLWNAATGKLLHSLKGHTDTVYSAAFSPDGARILTASWDNTARLWDAATGLQFASVFEFTSPQFSPDGRFIYGLMGGQSVGFVDAQTGKLLCRLYSFKNDEWAVVDEEGRYDGSNSGNVEGVHWVVGLEPISLAQTKSKNYVPGLLGIHLGLRPGRKLEPVSRIDPQKLHPTVEVTPPAEGTSKVGIRLVNRGGGLGDVLVKVNDKQLDLIPRGTRAALDAPEALYEIDLAGCQYLWPDGGEENNVLEVRAWNAEQQLSTRNIRIPVRSLRKEPVGPRDLHVIAVGISDYQSPALKLKYAAKDARDFAAAVRLAGERLMTEVTGGKLSVQLLTSDAGEPSQRPTKLNIYNAFQKVRAEAGVEDVVVVYLAGHGVSLQRSEGDLYYYLTADASSADPGNWLEASGESLKAISSKELSDWIGEVPAVKQVLVLDTCAAGAAADRLTDKRAMTNEDEQRTRAVDRLQDRSGFHILMGCASDRVSYEATQYAQGLLTHSLLMGMRAPGLLKVREAERGEHVDVAKLFQFASEQVPQLARGLGGIQRPLVAAPRGSSFDIGILFPEDKAAVPLTTPMPMVCRPSFQESRRPRDDLNFGKLLAAHLEAAGETRPGQSARFVYVPVDDFPEALLPSGRYKIQGDKITVELLVVLGNEDLISEVIEGKVSDLPALADAILDVMETGARSAREKSKTK